MADLQEPFELCKVFQNGSLLGISRHAEDDHILLTFRDRGVLVYNLQLQKLVNNWSLEQRDEVTFAAVCNRAAKNFVMVVNKSEIFIWKETDSDLKQCQRIQSSKEISSLLVWNTLQTDPVVVFQDGSLLSLSDVDTASQARMVKRRKTTTSSQNVFWSFALQHQNKPYSVLIMAHGENKYKVKIAIHGSPDCTDEKRRGMEWKLVPPEKDATLLSCCTCEEGHAIISYWSDGSLCVTELEFVLSVWSNTKKPSLTCRIIQRLRPLHCGKNKDKGSVALAAIDPEHVCLCGSVTVEEELKDTIMLWNIKYGTLQSLQILDKIPAIQPSLSQTSVLPNGASCASCIPGFICVGFFHSAVVCQFTVDPCSLASALGQLDSTSKFVKDQKSKPQLFVTPKLTKPEKNTWSKAIKKEDRLEKKVLNKLTDPSETPTLEAFSSQLNSYMEMKLRAEDKGDKDDNSHKTSRKEFKSARLLSQQFISGVLSRCASEKAFWARESVSKLLKTKYVPASSSKELLNCIMEKNDLELLKECFQKIKGIPEDTIVDCLRHVLRQARVAAENETESSQGHTEGDQMPLDKENAKYLCAILCYTMNDVFLLPCLKKLSFEDVILLLKFFMYLMDRGLLGFQDGVDCKSLTYPQILDWAGLLLNAHFSELVIQPEAHELLARCRKTVTQQIRTYGKLRALEGFLDHFKHKRRLPQAEKVGLYAIEELEL
ncbi:nucleolar protein 11-like [Acropora palmata]|uniref:nucleolar protein 11-like n=1 Tax=Acropora palmata TaxID=6131 RepID=UPI003D9FC7C6